MKWQFNELVDGITFEATVAYPTLVDMRYELVSLDDTKVEGYLQYGGRDGLLKLTLHVSCTILAANSGEPTSFQQTYEVSDAISELEKIEINLETEELDITPYVKECIDLFIPSYVVDETQTIPSTQGSEWKFISEEDFMASYNEEQTESKFANLSQLLNEKNKDD